MMVNISLYRLSFQGPIHLASPRKDYTTSDRFIHSDTLYAAITDALFSLNINNSNFVTPDFFLSSAFPYCYVNGYREYFFPRPYLIGIRLSDNIQKKWKKVKWIEKSIFEKWIQGNELDISEGSIHNDFLSQSEEFNEFILSEEQAKVKIPTDPKEDTEPYYVERIYFKDQSGLYFLAIFKNEDTKNTFQLALDYLQEVGIGSYRTIGFGRFSYEVEDITLHVPDPDQEATAWCTLSLFIPQSREQLHAMLSNASYQLIKRGGWITHHLYKYRKKSIMMFAEGSIFNIPSSHQADNFILDQKSLKIMGAIQDLSPTSGKESSSSSLIYIPHPIYRVGYGFFIPVKLNFNQ